MSLSKANITTLAGLLCHDLDNSTTISTFFDDIVELLGEYSKPAFISGSFVSITASTASYAFPSAALNILFEFYGKYLLPESSDRELEAYSKTSRTDAGTPKSYTLDLLEDTFRLYPVPSASSTVGGNSLGSAFTEDWVYTFFSEDRDATILDSFGLAIALLTNAREFSYASKHQDLPFASNCEELGNILLFLLGVSP